MKIATTKRFLEKRHMLDSSDSPALVKMQRHWSSIFWATLTIGILSVSMLLRITIGWIGWTIQLIFWMGATHELFMTWRIKRLFETKRVQSFDGLSASAHQERQET